MTRRLIREGDPPSGQLASPVPQYWNPSTEAFEDVLGAHGAPRAILYGPNGQPISQSNPLEVRVRELEAELAAMRGMLETGNAKVTLTGSDGKPLKGVGLSNEVRAGLPNRQAPAAGATTTLLEVTVPCILEWWYWIIHENADADMSLGVYRRTSTGGRVAYFYGLVDDHSGVTRTEIYRMSQLVDRAAALGVSPVQGLRGGRRAILFKGPLECPYGFTIDVTRVAEPSGDGYMWFTCNYREV